MGVTAFRVSNFRLSEPELQDVVSLIPDTA